MEREKFKRGNPVFLMLIDISAPQVLPQDFLSFSVLLA